MSSGSLSSMVPIFSVILAETLMNMYPLSVKMISSNLFTKTFVRMGTFAGLSSLFASSSILSKTITNPAFYLISFLQIIHVLASYTGFANLDVGTAMTIFYIYPLLNIVIKSIYTRTPIDFSVGLAMGIAFLGVFFISYPNIVNSPDFSNAKFYFGLIAILFAALTESITYYFYKLENLTNPFDSIFTLYFAGSVGMGFAGIAKPEYFDTEPINIAKLVAINGTIGLLAFMLRYYGLTRTSIEMYSILAFTSIISAYLLGWTILGEKPYISGLVGSGLIISSIYSIYKMGY